MGAMDYRGEATIIIIQGFIKSEQHIQKVGRRIERVGQLYLLRQKAIESKVESRGSGSSGQCLEGLSLMIIIWGHQIFVE